MRRKTPQEKKRLSYLKDRRNAYGENDKSSRRNIARSRRADHHTVRNRARLALVRVRASEGQLDDSEVLFTRRSTGRWRKAPDTPLAEVVAARLERRVALGIDAPERNAARLARVRRHLARHPDR
ncbi:hypothetical protein ACIQBJ_30335 [Kitasatospora sp. NPDC088391]|uniref:hypothetical protein n=1 Tax=Kitasatospora sp. NPDC088391 TaxID=3364074 RepID=UPI0038258A32